MSKLTNYRKTQKKLKFFCIIRPRLCEKKEDKNILCIDLTDNRTFVFCSTFFFCILGDLFLGGRGQSITDTDFCQIKSSYHLRPTLSCSPCRRLMQLLYHISMLQRCCRSNTLLLTENKNTSEQLTLFGK